VIPYAFAAFAAKKLIAGHHPENVNSRKVLDKLGFKFSHDESFPELGVDIPRYLLEGPSEEKK
jgi:ribosomal-protein-alanine N-acetyltransferase